uniref:Uncharacterized protein n=1 Tax=viral metagenome TaxID=1070528 RepID=A0A6M3J5L8_9ZZZZ
MGELVTNTKLNLASKTLIEQLPDHVSELIVELAQQNRVELWHITAGVLLSVYMEGRLSAFVLDPAWQEGLRQKDCTCQYEPCGKKFKGKHIGQLYCSNECGLLASGQKFDEVENFVELKPAPIEPGAIDSVSASPPAGWGGDNVDLPPLDEEISTSA